MSRARRTLPDKPPLALPTGRRLRRPAVHGVHAVQPREHQELVEHVDNNLRRRAPTVRQPRAYRSIRHARRHRRDQLGRKQQSGAAIGSKGNSRGPVAHTTLLDHRKIPPIRRVRLCNCRRGGEVQVLGIRRGSSPSFDRASRRSARPSRPTGAAARGIWAAWGNCNRRSWRLWARACTRARLYAYILCLPSLK